MKLNDIKPIKKSLLSEAEEKEIIVQIALTEAFAFSDITGLADKFVAAPFSQFRRDILKDFERKLKAWGMEAMHTLKKNDDFDESKHYAQTLIKIVNNPAAVADQLVHKVMLAQLNGTSQDVKIADAK
jgi:hypothetical protein